MLCIKINIWTQCIVDGKIVIYRKFNTNALYINLRIKSLDTIKIWICMYHIKRKNKVNNLVPSSGDGAKKPSGHLQGTSPSLQTS